MGGPTATLFVCFFFSAHAAAVPHCPFFFVVVLSLPTVTPPALCGGRRGRAPTHVGSLSASSVSHQPPPAVGRCVVAAAAVAPLTTQTPAAPPALARHGHCSRSGAGGQGGQEAASAPMERERDALPQPRPVAPAPPARTHAQRRRPTTARRTRRGPPSTSTPPPPPPPPPRSSRNLVIGQEDARGWVAVVAERRPSDPRRHRSRLCLRRCGVERRGVGTRAEAGAVGRGGGGGGGGSG